MLNILIEYVRMMLLLINNSMLLNHGALSAFHSLLKHHKINIQKEAAETISIITAGNTQQIQQLIDQQLLPTTHPPLPPVLDILTKVTDSP